VDCERSIIKHWMHPWDGLIKPYKGWVGGVTILLIVHANETRTKHRSFGPPVAKALIYLAFVMKLK